MQHDYHWHRARTRRNTSGTAAVALMLVVGIVGGMFTARIIPTDLAALHSASPAAQTTVSFGLCHTGGGANCVVDGDTFWMAHEKIRIADIDTPETHPPRCPLEADLGNKATRRLQALLNAGSLTLTIPERDTDRYGRKLRIVERHGQSLGDTLIAEGLARPWTGRRQPWCAT